MILCQSSLWGNATPRVSALHRGVTQVLPTGADVGTERGER